LEDHFTRIVFNLEAIECGTAQFCQRISPNFWPTVDVISFISTGKVIRKPVPTFRLAP